MPRERAVSPTWLLSVPIDSAVVTHRLLTRTDGTFVAPRQVIHRPRQTRGVGCGPNGTPVALTCMTPTRDERATTNLVTLVAERDIFMLQLPQPFHLPCQPSVLLLPRIIMFGRGF